MSAALFPLPFPLTVYLVAVPAVILLGLAKGGFYGIGTMATPMLALVLPPVTAATIVMPILIIQDFVSVWSFRHTWDRRIIAVMVPTACVGIFFGWLMASRVSDKAILGSLGAISILFAAQRLWVDRHGLLTQGVRLPTWIGMICGVATGFTSQIAHAGGPPYQIWVIPQRLPRDTLVGTTAITFAVVNWAKLPAYIALGQFTSVNMTLTAILLPLAIASTFAGVWLVRQIPVERFYVMMYWFMILLGSKLLWDGVT